ncbi:MAG: hypothetical protein SFV24_00295 [Gemmatimonadales bacterium]|nr:hypothetical protein [Gemmatimonadales bacterium]
MSHPTPSPPASHPIRGRAVAILVISLALAAIVSLRSLHATLLGWLDVIRVLMADHPAAGAAVFVALGALSAMVAFFSTAVLVPPAVAAWGQAGTVALLWLGWMLGGVASYLIGRGPGVLAARGLVSEARLAGYQRRIGAGAPFSLVLLFQLALPSEIPGYVLGVVRYPLAKYLVALAIAELPYALGVTLAGESFRQGRLVPLLGLGAGAALFLVVAWRTLHRHPALGAHSS